VNGGSKTVAARRKYNAWSSAVSDGGFATVSRRDGHQQHDSVNSAEAALTPPLGLMVVNIDTRGARGSTAYSIK